MFRLVRGFALRKEPTNIIKNRYFLLRRREYQLRLLQDERVKVDRSVLEMPIYYLLGRKDLVYAFGREATKWKHINCLADVNVESVLSRKGIVPYTVKDHLRVKGMIQTCGMSANIKYSYHSSDLVDILSDYGFQPYAQTNVPQGLWGLESDNWVYGLAKNPYNPEFISGGSAGGEAPMVAIRGTPFGIGSDSAGSLRMPASFCGAFSFKPSGSKRLSRKGRISLSGEEIQVIRYIDACMGFTTKNVRDLKFLLYRTIGKTKQNNWSVSNEWNYQKYQEALTKKLRFGMIKQTNEVTTAPAIINALDEVAQNLKSLGHEIIEFDFYELPKFKDNLFRYNGGVYGLIGQRLGEENPIPVIEEFVYLMAMGEQAVILKQLMETVPEKRQFYASLLPTNLPKFLQASRENQHLKNKFQNAWASLNLDYLLSPVLPYTSLLPGKSKYLINLLTFCAYQNLLEMPCGAIPVRLVRQNETEYKDYSFYGRYIQENVRRSVGLPVGIQITGRPAHDYQTIAAMKIIESTLDPIPKPK